MDHWRKIGSAAIELGLSERRIREYERAGLIHLRRDPQTRDRLFDDRDISQLRTIHRLIHEEGYTLHTLGELLRYAPCWKLTDCPNKDTCPVPRDPSTPCYEQRRRSAEIPCDADCAQCPIYQSKEQPCSRVVVCQPTTHANDSQSHPDATAPGRADATTPFDQIS